MTKASDNDYPSVLLTEQGSAPTSPAASHQRLYIRTSDHTLVTVNSSGTVASVSSGLGAWTDFTPTITAGGGGFSLGNGVLQGRYKLLDANTAQVSIFYQRGSSTTNGSGQYAVALPVTAKVTKPQVQVLHGYFLDSGTMYYVATGYVINNTASVGTIIVADSGSVHEWSATNPAVPATGDELGLSGILEI